VIDSLRVANVVYAAQHVPAPAGKCLLFFGILHDDFHQTSWKGMERIKLERGPAAFSGTLGNNAPLVGLWGTVMPQGRRLLLNHGGKPLCIMYRARTHASRVAFPRPWWLRCVSQFR
jgi:hypothetical protein